MDLSQVRVVDLFCGVGGLSYGLKSANLPISMGVDIDKTCKFAYEKNVGGVFLHKSIRSLQKQDITPFFEGAKYRILVGCAPCQTFSSYTQKNRNKNDEKWTLLDEFKRLIVEILPEIVSMENVPNLAKYPIFHSFVKTLCKLKYLVHYEVVFCPKYGIPQGRKRLVLVASRLGEIKLIAPTHTKDRYVTLRDTIGSLPRLRDGEQDKDDSLHIARKLTPINQKRIRSTPPNGGGWKDWSEDLILDCHKKESGKRFDAVYGRMRWDEPSPTMTTLCTSLGNGRFGHPEQHRAISLREASLLQTFPPSYDFIENKRLPIPMATISRHIGNAVPPKLGEVIGQSIVKHLKEVEEGADEKKCFERGGAKNLLGKIGKSHKIAKINKS